MNECTYIQRLEDTVENALVKVVLTRAPGIDGIGNHAQDGLDALFLAEVEIEAPAEVFDNLGTGVKAGTSAGAHHLHEEHDAFGVFAHGEVTLDAQGFVRVEGVRATALDVGVHHLQVFLGELERAGFKVDASGRRGEHETKVYVNQVTVVAQ